MSIKTGEFFRFCIKAGIPRGDACLSIAIDSAALLLVPRLSLHPQGPAEPSVLSGLDAPVARQSLAFHFSAEATVDMRCGL